MGLVRLLGLSAVLVLVLAAPSGNGASQQKSSPAATGSSGSDSEARKGYGELPLPFVPNKGQTDSRVHFLAQAGGASFFFTRKEAVFSFTRGKKGVVLRLAFLGANPATRIEGQHAGPGRINYFLGSAPSKWRTNLPTYEQVVYRKLWPGIDMVVSGTGDALKYEFRLALGAKVSDIRLDYRGADRLSLSRAGDLLIRTPLGVIRDQRPQSYQVIDGARVVVKGRFHLKPQSTGYGFVMGKYDRSRPLVLDPGLVYSTYLGGSAADQGLDIAVGGDGSAYLTGVTSSSNFPTTTGATQTSLRGGTDGFVTKLDGVGSALVYSSYFGGSCDEATSAGIAVDGEGSAYVTGDTCSSDLPTTPGAFRTTFGGSTEAYLTKLNASGSALVYSTYVGASSRGSGLAVDVSGNVYVTGLTNSTSFSTTTGAFQVTYGGGNADAFVTKLNAEGSDLVYSTYLGGQAEDAGADIAVGDDGSAYITGSTTSSNFPTTVGAFQVAYGSSHDAFVTKVNADGSALAYSTYLHARFDPDGDASFREVGEGIAVGADGSAYVTGAANGLGFPTTPGAFQRATVGIVNDAFVTKLNPSGSALGYSTLLAGSGVDFGSDIAVDRDGNAYVTGATGSDAEPHHLIQGTFNFPATTRAFQTAHRGGSDDRFASDDAFVTKLNATGSALMYSSYLGGSGIDQGRGIAVHDDGTVYVTGLTSSSDFPSLGAVQTAYGGGTFDAFVTKLDVSVDIVPMTYRVNSNADPGDGTCDATCTLRDAILASNLVGARDTIALDLPAGSTTIGPTTELPALSERVIIDGATQPGFASRPIVRLDGANTRRTDDPALGEAPKPARGLHVFRLWRGVDGESTIRSLAITRFESSGIFLLGEGNSIVGNYIGTNVAEERDLGNGSACDLVGVRCLGIGGVDALGGTNTIGGSDPADRNLIAGNGDPNVHASGGDFVVIEGNYIGMNSTLSSSLDSQFGGDGVFIEGRGGTVAGNVFGSHGGGTAINVLVSPGGSGFAITGNRIGQIRPGRSASPYSIGISIGGAADAPKVVVGTPEPGGGNVIAFNRNEGIRVGSGHAEIRFNKIFANGLPIGPFGDRLGIDLFADGRAGVTANDLGDGDTGPNDLQNFPVLTSVNRGTNDTAITGILNSSPNTTFLVDFYVNVAGADPAAGSYAACDTSGFGEGETHIGTTTVRTNASGDVTFSHTVSGVLAEGAAVTATATDPAGDTSEFSACEPKPNQAPGTIVVSKETVPAGSSQSFRFTASYSPTGFSLTDGQSNTSAPLAPGSYSVRESPVSGWTVSATCSDGSPVSNISLDPGETVTCSFVNTQRSDTGCGLLYSSFLGGSGFDLGNDVVVDESGSAYITGFTTSTNFPTTTGVFQVATGGGQDAFVTKVSASGSALVYSSYLGGSGSDTGGSIGIGADGSTYVVGQTLSTNFPTTPNAFQTASGGGRDVFVTKLNASGSALTYSSYLGGSDGDGAGGIAIDVGGSAYLTGDTFSTNFPTTAGALQTTPGGGVADAFVTKVSQSGSALAYSGYLGGSGFENGRDIAVDQIGSAYVTGNTTSSNFPTTAGAFQTASGGFADAFVSKLNASGSALAYSSYLGGGSSEVGGDIALDGDRNAYITGTTGSSNFPTTPAAFQTSPGGSTDAFVTKLNASGNALAYSSYLGGSDMEAGIGIAVDGDASALVTGETWSSNYPTTAGSLQTTFGGGVVDAFVTKVTAGGSALGYSSYLGGGGFEQGLGIAVDQDGSAYVTGHTEGGFPTTTGAFQPTFGGSNRDGFVSKLSLSPCGGTGTIVVKKETLPAGSTQGFAFTATYSATGFTLSDGQSNTSAPLAPGSYSVSETPVTGWNVSASCSDGSPVTNISLDSGETVTCTFTNTANPYFLVIDEDSIDNGTPPNKFSAKAVNDQIARIGLRALLPAFSGANVGKTITLYTGQVGDEGWFALKTIPAAWASAGPATDGVRNYLAAGPGLGSPNAQGDREALLDRIPNVTPLRATGLKLLTGRRICAVVYDGDVSINYGPLTGSLKGANLGRVALEVVSVTKFTGGSSSALPKLQVKILNADAVCAEPLALLSAAPAPISSSQPPDVTP